MVNSPIDSDDFIDIALTARTESTTDAPLWDTESAIQQGNKSVHIITTNFYEGKNTYVIKSKVPLKGSFLRAQIINNANPESTEVNDLKFSIKLEVNDVVKVNEENVVLSGINKNYTKEFEF